MSSIPQSKEHHGSRYLLENVDRAMRSLIDPNLPYAERIQEACFNAHRPERYDGTVGAMSHDTLKAWDACDPGRFAKPFSEMPENEVAAIADSLIFYLMNMSLDHGIACAGQDPAEYSRGSHLDTYADGNEIREARCKPIASGS